jgi:hypothetical protein
MSLNGKNIALLSIMFLAVFAGALTTSALCDLKIIDYAANLSHQHDDVHEHSNPHQHDIKTGEHSTNDHGAGHHGGQPDSEACCKEIATSLDSSLFYYSFHSTVPIVKYFLVKTIDFNHKIILNYKQLNIIYHEYDNPPPLEGFSLRVVIQSFLN